MPYCDCPCAGCSGCTGYPEAPRGLIQPEPGSAEFFARYVRRDTASVVFHPGAGCPGHTTGTPAPECLGYPLTSQAGTDPA